jgi:phytoene desaturase
LNRTPPENARVVVIGAGPGGLAAALLLASQGLRVTVFESQDEVGGRTRTWSAPGGFKFDLGPTFFLYPRILAEIFEACGERLEDHVELKRLDPLYHLVFEGGGELRPSPDPDRLAAEIAKICPHDARNVRAYLKDNRAKLAAFKPILERSFSSARDMGSPTLMAALPHLRPHATVDGDLKRYFADPRVRLAFSFQSKYLGMSPFNCPSLFTILSFLEYEHGVFHPVGGCGAVTEAMAALARRMGVDIRLGEPVERIVMEDGRAVAVEVDGERQAAEAVVVNGDFGHAVRRLLPESARPRWPDAKIARARVSCSTFMMYLGIEGGVGPLAHHTVLLSREYERNIAEIGGGILPLEPSIYVQNPGATDDGFAPPGHTSLYVLVPVPNTRAGIDWSAEKERYAALVLDRLGALGLPDLAARVRFQRIVTPQDWEMDHGVFDGATFNLAHDLRQMLYFRPHNRFAPGVYLVGGGTHPGSGLPVIFEGARITARLVSQDLRSRSVRPRFLRRPSWGRSAPPQGAVVP